jgi:hypothetical protein
VPRLGNIGCDAATSFGEKLVAQTIEEILPSAKQAMQKLAEAQAEEATKQMRRDAEAAAAKKALIEHLQAPSGVSDEEAIRRAIKIIERAIGNGQTEVQVYRFPNTLCTDGGRAINQQEPGWDSTLTGVPREIFQLWDRYFRPRGYKLRAEILNFPGGMPGDVGLTLKWS